VVWLDEVEKALQGATSGSADGGVSSDALGAILTWMEERRGGSFVIATANDVSLLPPEFLRKGRFDDVWFVDLPTAEERMAIVEAALTKHGRDPLAVMPIAIANATDGFTGAEIARDRHRRHAGGRRAGHAAKQDGRREDREASRVGSRPRAPGDTLQGRGDEEGGAGESRPRLVNVSHETHRRRKQETSKMTTIQASTLRPGLLVSLKTTLTGNTRYTKQTIEGEHVTAAGEQRARWETERVVSDPAEKELADKARGKASGLIRGVCAKSAFGLLCPEADADRLTEAVAEARKVADEFNAMAKLSRLYVNVITGRIAPDDVEAVKAINSEVRDLLAEMEDGVKRLDVKAVRDAAARARSVGQMLSQDAQVRLQFAIDAVRQTATAINKAGDAAAVEIDKRTLRTLAEARTAFLDLDDAKEVKAPKAKAAALDLDPDIKAASDEYVASQKRQRKAQAKLEF
jgi:hypothetical protein